MGRALLNEHGPHSVLEEFLNLSVMGIKSHMTLFGERARGIWWLSWYPIMSSKILGLYIIDARNILTPLVTNRMLPDIVKCPLGCKITLAENHPSRS